MKLHSIVLSGLLVSNCVAIAVDGNDHRRYYAELQALKEAPDTRMMFDKDAHKGLVWIQSDITTCKKLSLFQRIVRALILSFDVVMVTPETMPLLYDYVGDVCKKADIEAPTIFITRRRFVDDSLAKEIFGMSFKGCCGFAQKLLMSKGVIVIEQKIMREISDEALQAVITHEIGHIKHNHINKSLCLGAITGLLATLAISNSEVMHSIFMPHPEDGKLLIYGKRTLLSTVILGFMGLIINKRFEKEADEFACKYNGKAEGLIETCQWWLKKRELREEEFETIYNLLQANKALLSSIGYYELLLRYYVEKVVYKVNQLCLMIQEETFFGVHPSPQARIAAAQKYLAQQQQ